MKLRFLASALLLLAASAWAGPSMTSGNNTIARGVDDAGGGTSSTASNRLAFSVAEGVILTTMSTSANTLRSGWSQIASFPGTLPTLTIRPDIGVSSFTMNWSSPGLDGNSGALPAGTAYLIQVASAAYTSRFANTASVSVSLSTSGTNPGTGVGASVTGLDPNTTYFATVWARDPDGNLSLPTVFQSTAVTLANPPSQGALEFLAVQWSSVTVAWAALPTNVSSKSCEGYVLQASSNNFGALAGSAPVISSTTYTVSASTLTVGANGTPLDLSSTYYFQVGSLNWAGQANYTTLPKLNFQIVQSTNYINFGQMAWINGSLVVSTISTSSMVVTNVGNWPATLLLAASTATVPSSPWTLSTSSGIEQAALLGVWNSGSVGPPGSAFKTYLTTAATASQAAGSYSGNQNGYELPAGASVTLWFRFFFPTTTASPGPKETIQVTSQPVYP